MEENIIKKIAEKKVYDVEEYVAGENTCSLVVVNCKGRIIRNDLSLKIVKPLLKKHNWFERCFYGKVYRSVYSTEEIPYFDVEWKNFVWREFLDGQEISCNENFPQNLSNFFHQFDMLYSIFIKKFKSLLNQRKDNTPRKHLSVLMEIYWNDIKRNYSDKVEILSYLYPFLVQISYDKKVPYCCNKPISIERFLCKTQHIENIDFDYDELVNDYTESLYNYLLFSYHDDNSILSDLCGGEEYITADETTVYDKHLLFLKAIDQVITYLDFE